MKNAIEINNLSACYNRHCVLENINMSIEEGEFLGIIGPNGGGKTTLAKVILGILPPSGGSVLVYGKPPKEARGTVGYVPQFITFEKDFPISVREVVLTGLLGGLRPFRRYGREEFNRVNRIMERLGMESLGEKPVKVLSGGETQKMLIARAMVTNPKILILDEPTASVDADAKNGIYTLLKELNLDMTIILITHDMGAVSENVGSIACLNKKLFYHGQDEMNANIIESAYGCPVDLIAHGAPHRVLKSHSEGGDYDD